MVNKDGEEEELLCLPELSTTQELGMDMDNTNKQGDDKSDDPVTTTLTWIIWTAAPDDLLMLESMLDQLELENYSEDITEEIAPDMSTRVTDMMRMAMVDEAAKANMSVLEYIEDTSMALCLSIATPGDDEENNIEEVPKMQHDEDSFISLPDLSIGEDIGGSVDAGSKTGIPQGSDNKAHQGSGLPKAAALWQRAGAVVITTQTGDLPG